MSVGYSTATLGRKVAWHICDRVAKWTGKDVWDNSQAHGSGNAHNHYCHCTFRGQDTWSLSSYHGLWQLSFPENRNCEESQIDMISIQHRNTSWECKVAARILFSVLWTRNPFPCDPGRDSCGRSPSGFWSLFLEMALPCLLIANAFFTVPSALCGCYVPTACSNVRNLLNLLTEFTFAFHMIIKMTNILQ
jgi:hypothetical protein